MSVQSGPTAYDPSLTVAEQLAELRGKLAQMRKNREAFVIRKNALAALISEGRRQIAEAKAVNDADVLYGIRVMVAEWLSEQDKLTVAPPDEGSVKYKAIQQRIAELEAQNASDAAQAPYGQDYVTTAKAVIDAARPVRQATGDVAWKKKLATEPALEAAAEAARLARIDGV